MLAIDDTGKQRALLCTIRVPARHPKPQPPRVLFTGFGDSSLDFTLHVFYDNNI